MLILLFEAMSCDLWNKYLAFTFTTKVAPLLSGGTSEPPLQTHVFNTMPSLPGIYRSRKCSLARAALRMSPQSVPYNRSGSCGCF